MNTERIEYHIAQARRFNIAVADPNLAEWEIARKTREHATYHLNMVDWYMAEPEPPASIKNMENAHDHEERSPQGDQPTPTGD